MTSHHLHQNRDSIPVAEWITPSTTAEDVRSIIEFLSHQGTFHFPSLPNGLFSAASGEGGDFELTGYRNVWLRDNVQIAWAHLVVQQDPATAVRCVTALNRFYRRHADRFVSIIRGKADFNEPMNRPHIRFNGNDLTELSEKWSHAQNDALGYWLWINCELISRGAIVKETVDWSLPAMLVQYWKTIGVWQDEDSGHWEEVRKVAASSIGCALAGLRYLSVLMQDAFIAEQLRTADTPITLHDVLDLMEKCDAAMRAILPWECRQSDPAKQRRYDGALLFLIYPLNIIEDPELEDRILADVGAQLQGPYGIRRYPGDSYWCADYRDLLSADQRTADFSDSLDARDRLLKPGMEAQWCIFDPIVACIHGRRYQFRRDAVSLQRQIAATQRSLSQLTSHGSRFAAWRCPESYFCENGAWIPNDITPLLWTQANLWQALTMLEENLRRA
ncbi:MAG: glycoside hydrolase family 15 protein [Planctomycetota bacterium]